MQVMKMPIEEILMANMAQAIRMALHYAEENMQLMDVFGEDVGPPLAAYSPPPKVSNAPGTPR